MKNHYEVEYISSQGRFTIECFATKAAAFKFTRTNSDWQIVYKVCNGAREILADNFAFIRMKQALDEATKIR